MFRSPIRFSGDVSKQRMVETASPLLLHLVNLNLGRYSNDSFNTSEPVSLNMCPFLQFNAKKKAPTTTDPNHNYKHNLSNEQPLPVFIGIVIYEKTRKALSTIAWPIMVVITS